MNAGVSSLVQLNEGALFANDFRVVRPLSEGGMGAVYVAEQLSTGKLRALKLMLPQLVNDPRMRERFVLEARIGARIESDHVVDVLGAGIDSEYNVPWLAMELLQGETLEARVETRGPVPVDDLLEIFSQLSHALTAAHGVGIVHRDLKPENIYLANPRREGIPFTVKVLDFGIAKMMAEQSTRATQAIGSPLWMAPEQGNAEAVTPATDIWSLGLVAFYALTGKYFWKGAHTTSPNPMTIVVEVCHDPIPPASDRALEWGGKPLPIEFDAWFARCLDRDPAGRFSSAKEAKQELERALSPKRASQLSGSEIALSGPRLEAPDLDLPKPAAKAPPPKAEPPAANSGALVLEMPGGSSAPGFSKEGAPRASGTSAPRMQAVTGTSTPRMQAVTGTSSPRMAAVSDPIELDHPGSAPAVQRNSVPTSAPITPAPAGPRSAPSAGAPPGRPLGLSGVDRPGRSGMYRPPPSTTLGEPATFPWKWAVVGVVAVVGGLVVAQRMFWTRPTQPVEPTPPPVVESTPKPASSAPLPPCPAGMARMPAGEQIESFCMDLHEVTVKDYAACAKGGKCTAASGTGNWGAVTTEEKTQRNASCNAARPDRADHPANCIDHVQAEAYCEAQGKRLPSEAEWQWAAHGGGAKWKHPWGNAQPDIQLCWSAFTKRTSTCAVGAYPKGVNGWGILDLEGNVREWVSTGAGSDRMLCGSDWTDKADSLSTAGGCGQAPRTSKASFLGFRCASS